MRVVATSAIRSLVVFMGSLVVGLARVAELVLARAAFGVAFDVEGHGVDTVLQLDLGLDRFGAALAPYARFVLARLEAAEVELLRTVDGNVRGRVDDEDERRHV